MLIVGNDTAVVRKGSCAYQDCANKQSHRVIIIVLLYVKLIVHKASLIMSAK